MDLQPPSPPRPTESSDRAPTSQWESITPKERQPRLARARATELLDQKAASPEEEKRELKSGFARFAKSWKGLSLLAFLLVFALLVIVRPSWLYRRPEGEEDYRVVQNLKWGLIFGISIGSAVLVALAMFGRSRMQQRGAKTS